MPATNRIVGLCGVATFVLVFAVPSAAQIGSDQPRQAQTIDLSGCPVKVMIYQVRFEDGEGIAPGLRGVYHEVTYLNRNDHLFAEAVEFGFVTLDPWDDPEKLATGTAIMPVNPEKMRTAKWVDPLEFLTFTSIVFVRKVRLSDGTIWTADPDELLEKLRAYIPDMKMDQLVPEKTYVPSSLIAG